MVNKFSKKDTLSYRMVCRFYRNKPVCTRAPHLVMLCDDTADFICISLQPDKLSEIGLVVRASLKRDHTNSTFHHDNSNQMNGRKVKHHVIGNVTEDTAPMCILILYSDAELLGGQDFVVRDVEGLGPGGFGVNCLK